MDTKNLVDKDKVALVRDRFIMRDDVYSNQWYNPTKGVGYFRVTEGVCPNKPPCPKRLCPHVTNARLTDDVLLSHLLGNETLAIFQLSQDNMVKWLCLDVDITKGTDIDAATLAASVREHTRRLWGATDIYLGRNVVLIERSGSKGYHLWVFFNEPVQARYAFTLGHFIESAVLPPDGIHVEVFPKQVAAGSYGSMVKLPLGIHLKTNTRCFFVDDAFKDLEDQWTPLANVERLSEKQVLDILRINNVPVVSTIRTEGTGGARVGFPCMGRIMREGLQEGERDTGIFYLTLYLKERDVPENLAAPLIHSVNKLGYPLSGDAVDTKISSAYNNDYTSFPCGTQALDKFCSSSCKFWNRKVQDRWERYGRTRSLAVGRISRD